LTLKYLSDRRSAAEAQVTEHKGARERLVGMLNEVNKTPTKARGQGGRTPLKGSSMGEGGAAGGAGGGGPGGRASEQQAFKTWCVQGSLSRCCLCALVVISALRWPLTLQRTHLRRIRAASRAAGSWLHDVDEDEKAAVLSLEQVSLTPTQPLASTQPLLVPPSAPRCTTPCAGVVLTLCWPCADVVLTLC